MKINRTLKNNFGFTLIELLITVAILAVLIILTMMAWQNHLNQARDAQRKSDLERIRIAFEDYYNDKGCFPAEDILQICEGNSLDPYLNNIPCDPVYGLPYCYVHDPEATCGQSYKILAPLKANNDPIIEKLFCGGELYCGYELNCASTIAIPPSSDYGGFNYGVTSSNVQLSTQTPGATPTPTPSSSPYGNFNYACDAEGICNSFADPLANGCSIWHPAEEVCTSNCCEGDCDDPVNWCTN